MDNIIVNNIHVTLCGKITVWRKISPKVLCQEEGKEEDKDGLPKTETVFVRKTADKSKQRIDHRLLQPSLAVIVKSMFTCRTKVYAEF